MICYNNCNEAEREYGIDLLSEDDKCVRECSLGYGLEKEESKKCINCVDNKQRVVDGVCKEKCPIGTSTTAEGVCKLPEDLIESESNNDLCKNVIENVSYCENEGICFVSNNRPFCNCTNSFGLRCEFNKENAASFINETLNELNLQIDLKNMTTKGKIKTLNKVVSQNDALLSTIEKNTFNTYTANIIDEMIKNETKLERSIINLIGISIKRYLYDLGNNKSRYLDEDIEFYLQNKRS